MVRSFAAFAVLLCAVAPQPAAGFPIVVDIRADDALSTRIEVLRREMALDIGDPADPALVARSQQGLLDLELFHEVTIDEVPEGDGVALVISGREKRFLLAVPRFDSSSDGDLSYGAYLRWDNIRGLDHTFDARFLTGEFPDDRLREEETSARIRYAAPFAFGRHGWSTELEHFDRVAPVAGGNFDETIHRVEVLVSHDFRDTRPRSGWILSSGVNWRRQNAEGLLAPPSEGGATALVVGAQYSNVRFHVYSETGRQFISRLALARDGVLSDYSYRTLDARLVERIPLQSGAHHSLHLIAAAGWHGGGPRRVSAYALGGSTALRGYELDHLEGERYGYLAAEYLRPLFGHNWLRLLVVAESGWTGGVVTGARSGGPFASIGAGLRIRVTWFMNLELELGIAHPLRGGDGMQFFAGAV